MENDEEVMKILSLYPSLNIHNIDRNKGVRFVEKHSTLIEEVFETIEDGRRIVNEARQLLEDVFVSNNNNNPHSLDQTLNIIYIFIFYIELN